jgi:hypothetical protein
MVATRNLQVKGGDILLLAGTTKGLFRVRHPARRRSGRK